MSALAKIYAPRTSEVKHIDLLEKNAPSVYAPKMSEAPDNIQRRIGMPNSFASIQHPRNEIELPRPDVQRRDLKVALNMIENVNSGFIDVFNRLEESENTRSRILSEFEEQNQLVLQLQFELEQAKERAADAEVENAELADRLVTETARASATENQLQQMGITMNSASHRIAELEENCKNFHDSIISTFGVGSPTHSALNSLSNR